MTHDGKVPEYRYGVVREEYVFKGERRIAYGIAVYAHPRESGCACIIASVRDISPDRTAVETLVRQCNAGDLSPAHLADVIHDHFDV